MDVDFAREEERDGAIDRETFFVREGEEGKMGKLEGNTIHQ